jgi:hypothetical protein
VIDPRGRLAKVYLTQMSYSSVGQQAEHRLFLFFATWDTEVTDLGSALEALAGYQAVARADRLPKLTAIDEGSVEPSVSALPRFLQELRSPLPYPVAIDRSGRVADGYGVQDEPWYVLVSTTGRVLWYHDVSTSGWLGTNALLREVRAALARPQAPSGSASQSLAGSAPALAALHRQAGQLLGGEAALSGRLGELRGYPVVINAWSQR